jgi:hypothetical protein|tara:strand:+ start:319 stop:735 length:417 start_codon:yes stop_codon:yes gene_type:complete
MEAELLELYEDALEEKVKVEICYTMLRENYINFRMMAYVSSRKNMKKIQKQLEHYSNSFKVDSMIDEYKELLSKYLKLKEKMSKLVTLSQSIISEEELNAMIEEQDKMISVVEKINSKIPEKDLKNIYDSITDKISSD